MASITFESSLLTSHALLVGPWLRPKPSIAMMSGARSHIPVVWKTLAATSGQPNNIAEAGTMLFDALALSQMKYRRVELTQMQHGQSV
jgi:hypothetical protein